MPRVKLPITEWNPANGALLNPGVIGVSEAIPLASGWSISPKISTTEITSPSTYTIAQLYGLHLHPVESSTTQKWLFAGMHNKLLRGSAADSSTMGTAIGAATFSTPNADSGWQFASFGNAIYATNGNFTDPIQYAAAPATDFVTSNIIVTPSSYDPYCKYMTTIKNHLLIGNINFTAAPSVAIPTSALTGTSYPHMVMWSATDAPRRFGDPKAAPEILGSDYQDLLDGYGPVTGLSGGDFAYIFKPRAVYVMEGPPWTFRPLFVGLGTVYCNSIVRYFDDVYFWSTAGPVRINASRSEPDFLANSKLYPPIIDTNQTLNIPHYSYAATNNPSYSGLSHPSGARMVHGWADMKRGLICWSFDSQTISSSSFIGSSVLVYNISEDRWGYFQFNALANPALNLSGQTCVYQKSYPSSSSAATLMDDVYFLGGSAVDAKVGIGRYVMTGGTNAGGLGGRELTAEGLSIKTGYFSLPISDSMESTEATKTSRITRIRPLYSMQYGESNTLLSSSVKVRTFTRYPDNNGPHIVTSSYATTDSYQQNEGWIDITGALGLYHQIELALLDDSDNSARYLTDFKAIEIEFVLASAVGSANKG